MTVESKLRRIKRQYSQTYGDVTVGIECLSAWDNDVKYRMKIVIDTKGSYLFTTAPTIRQLLKRADRGTMYHATHGISASETFVKSERSSRG